MPRRWLVTEGELRLGWNVATSVSEWTRFHSLTLVATQEQKTSEGDHYRRVFAEPTIQYTSRPASTKAPTP